MKLETHNLTKNYGEKCAVDHVNLEFERGIYGLRTKSLLLIPYLLLRKII